MPTLPSNRTSTNSDLRSPRLSHYSVDGTITLLAQEEISGLRAQRIDGEWISIPPIAGGIAVNIGEMLMRWRGLDEDASLFVWIDSDSD